MRIKRVRLSNRYKRFSDLTIDLGDQPARIIALVGPNGSGKSSVLDGLMLHAHQHNKIGTRSNGRGPDYYSMDNSPSAITGTEVEFVNGSYGQELQRRIDQGRGNTLFSFRSPYRFNGDVKLYETQGTNHISLNNYGASDASSLDSKMIENYRRLHSFYYRYIETENARPSEAKAHIIGGLNLSIRNCVDVELSSLGSIEDGRGTLYFKKADHPIEFEYNVLSSGEKEVVDILLDLYLRKSAYDETVFLFDEPELHINTSIQKNLLIEINRLVGDNCQIWITTHSIGFLRALQSEMKGQYQIIQFRDDQDLASKAVTLRPNKMTPAKWRELFSVALDDLAALVSPKTIIYCEGRADPGTHGKEKGMDAQVFNNIFGQSHPDAMFVSSGGNTELDQRSTIAIEIIGKVFQDVEILVLKDRDMASGKLTDDNDRRIYLKNNPQNHRLLKRWEIENYLYDKEVLKAYCLGVGLVFNETAYDLLVRDIANQDLKADTARIRNCCNIVGSINADRFKIALSEYVSEDMSVFRELQDCIFSSVP